MVGILTGSATLPQSVQSKIEDRTSAMPVAFTFLRRAAILRTLGFAFLLLPTKDLRLTQARVSPLVADLVDAGFTVPPGEGRLVGGFEPGLGGAFSPGKNARGQEAVRRFEEQSVPDDDQAVLSLVQSDSAEEAIHYLLPHAAAETDSAGALRLRSWAAPALRLKAQRNADRWSNLAFAYLRRFSLSCEGRQKGELFDLVLALHAADQALLWQFPHPEAQFNLALALDRLHIDSAAVEAWDDVLAHHPPPAWERLARHYRAGAASRQKRAALVQRERIRLGEHLSQGEPPSPELLEWARPFLRTELEDVLPGVLLQIADSPQSPGARKRLTALGSISWGLGNRIGDFFAWDVFRDARAAIGRGDAQERARWVSGLKDLENGNLLMKLHAYSKAEEAFRRASLALKALDSPLRWSAEVRLQDARIQVKEGTDRESSARLDRVIQSLGLLKQAISDKRYPGLFARSIWLEGLALGKRGFSFDSLNRLRDAERRYSELAEQQNLGAMQSLQGELLRLTGRTLKDWTFRLTALRQLSEVGDVQRLHNVLGDAQEAAVDVNWRSLADRLQQVGLRQAGSQRDPENTVELLKLRARRALDAEGYSEAGEALAQAEKALKDVPQDSDFKRIFRCDLDRLGLELRAVQEGDTDVRRLLENLAKRCPSDPNVLAPDERDLEARAHLRRGELSQARETEEEALTEVLRQAGELPDLEQRKALLDKHRAKLERLVDWLFDANDSEHALAWVLDFFETEARGESRQWLEARSELSSGRAVEPGQGVLVLQATRKRLYGWLLTTEGLHPFEAGESVRNAISDWQDSLPSKLGSPKDSGRVALRDFSRELLGPIASRFDQLRRLVVVPSDVLREIPYSALLDPLALDAGEDRYLVERLEVSIAVPAADRRHLPRVSSLTAASPALFVGNPRNVIAEEDMFEELRGARKEAEAGAKLFTAARLLRDNEATKSAILERLLRVSLAHLGAHTARVIDGTALLVANPSKVEATIGQLTGDEILDLDLSHLQLVVLAACRSAEPGQPAVNSAGLVEPFLAAGSGAVIASLWKVDDRLSPDLWKSFYPRLIAGESPESALRRAQIDCIKKTGSNLANPAFWAGFAVYHGDLPLKGE